MKLNRRLEALEKELLSDPIVLLMLDGSTATITGPSDYLLRLFEIVAGRREIYPEQAEQLDLIRQCTSSKEPGDAHLVDVMRCFLFGPAKTGSQTGEAVPPA